MADEPKKGEPRPLVLDFGGLELQGGDSVTVDLPIDADAYSRFRDYSVRSVLRMFCGDGYARPKTIEGEATHIAGELPAPEEEGDGRG